MSEHLTHIAVCEDSIRLILHSDEIHEDIKRSLRTFPDIALFSSSSRGNHLFAVPFIEKVRDEGPFEHSDEILASGIGWLTHRAIDLQVKPLEPSYYENINDPHFSKDEADAYQDAVTFKKVFGGGNKRSLSPHIQFSEDILTYGMDDHPGSRLLHTYYVEPHVVSLIKQNLMALHKFNAESPNLEEWLEKFSDSYQQSTEDLRVYIEAFTEPDPKKMEVYIYAVNFYNDNDDIIRLVRSLQDQGETDLSLHEALQKAEDQSHYAQGLAKSYKYLKNASDFYENKISKDALYDAVENFNENHRI